MYFYPMWFMQDLQFLIGRRLHKPRELYGRGVYQFLTCGSECNWSELSLFDSFVVQISQFLTICSRFRGFRLLHGGVSLGNAFPLDGRILISRPIDISFSFYVRVRIKERRKKKILSITRIYSSRNSLHRINLALREEISNSIKSNSIPKNRANRI